MCGNNQLGSNQPGGQPSGGNQPWGGGGGPAPYWPQTSEDRRRVPNPDRVEDSLRLNPVCVQDRCGRDSQKESYCLKSFFEKVVLRDKAIKDPSLCRTFKATLSERSNVVNRVGNEKVDFTGHELETLVKVVNLVKKDGHYSCEVCCIKQKGKF